MKRALWIILVAVSCSSSERRPEEESSAPAHNGSAESRRAGSAEELIARCRNIEPRVPACDRLDKELASDSTALPRSTPSGADPNTGTNLHAQTLKTERDRVTHANAMLAAIRSAAIKNMRELEDSLPTTRDAVVRNLAAVITQASAELIAVAAELPNKERAKLHASANNAADAVLQVVTWIDSRRPNSEMTSVIESAVKQMDSPLVAFGVHPVGSRPVPPLMQREAEEADVEVRAATRAASALSNDIEAELSLREASRRNK
jgi:hypothetical protein